MDNKHQKKALICGISGQDGAYLAKYLLSIGYRVWGSSRQLMKNSFPNLESLDILHLIDTVSMDPSKRENVFSTISKIQPDEIYQLSGQSSVGKSFSLPSETINSSVSGTLNLLEYLREANPSIRLYHAGSAEVFGDTGENKADENSVFDPQSPYAVGKASATWLVNSYRKSYGIFACTGILFNHESPLRNHNFVTKKVVDAAIRISSGSDEKLVLGNLNIVRDWGWAEDFVISMQKMLQLNEPQDFVISTGTSISLEKFVETVFCEAGLDWREHLSIDKNLLRPADQKLSCGNPTRAMNTLGWTSSIKGCDVPKKMFHGTLSLKSEEVGQIGV